MRLKSLFLFSLMMALCNTGVRADLSFVLTPAAETCAQSNEVFFSGVLSNTNPTNDVYLNDIQFTANSNLVAVANAFFANVPGILSAGQTYSDVVFAETVNPTVAVGNYSGAVT